MIEIQERQHKRDYIRPRGRPVTIDLCAQHILCELNYHRLLRFMPGWREGVSQWSVHRGDRRNKAASLRVTQSAPYTTTVLLQQDFGIGLSPKIAVRLYHDAAMAEIVAWDNHRHWRSSYTYPNQKMYQPDEKASLNRFLYDWLNFYRNSSFFSQKVCDIGHV